MTSLYCIQNVCLLGSWYIKPIVLLSIMKYFWKTSEYPRLVVRGAPGSQAGADLLPTGRGTGGLAVGLGREDGLGEQRWEAGEGGFMPPSQGSTVASPHIWPDLPLWEGKGSEWGQGRGTPPCPHCMLLPQGARAGKKSRLGTRRTGHWQLKRDVCAI